MTVSTSVNIASYSANGSTTTFSYPFKIFADGDLKVFIRAADGTETLKTLTTDYTVTNAGNENGGNVVFGTAPVATETVVIQRFLDLTQETDYVANDPFPAESHEEALDRLTMISQQLQEEIDRSIKASVTNSISTTEFTISAADRANKLFAFDGSGDITVTQEIGTFRGDWSSGTAFQVRDLVKDTSTNNIFLANTAHTSSGSQPITTNTDSAKWDLIVDAAAATTSANAAASSATDAGTAQTAAEAAQSAAETAQTAAETAQSDAETAQTAAESAQASTEAVFDNFDDRYLGAKASDPATDNDGDALITGALYFNTTSGMKVYDGSAWDDIKPTTADQASIDTVAGITADVTTVAGISANVTTVAGISSDVTTVAGIDSDVTAVAADATDIGAVATNISNVNTVAGISSDVTTVAADGTDIGTVAGLSSDVQTLADIEDGTVATNAISNAGSVSTDITTVAGQISPTNNLSTVAGVASDVATVAGISANVTTVAGIESDVTAVAGDASDINTVVTNIANINLVASNINTGIISGILDFGAVDDAVSSSTDYGSV